MKNISIFVDKMNESYRRILIRSAKQANTDKPTHVFLTDLEYANELETKFYDIGKTYCAKKYEVIAYKPLANPKIIPISREPEYKSLEHEHIEAVLQELAEVDNWNLLREKLDNMSDYMLPSTIPLIATGFQSYLNHIRNNGKRKVLILGAGPAGLFISLYLSKLYNGRIDVLVLDNRIVNDEYREPYLRNRFFAIGFDHLTYIMPKIACQTDKDVLFFGIRYLESLLYVHAYRDRVPIYFTDKYTQTWDDVRKFMNANNFDIVYDCTGGRMKIPQFDTYKPDHDVLVNDLNKLVMESKRGDIVLSNNYYHLNIREMMPIYRHYLSIETYDNAYNFIEYRTYHVQSIKTLEMLSDYNNVMMSRNDYIKLVGLVFDDCMRSLMGRLIYKTNNAYYRITVFEPHIRHRTHMIDVFDKHKLYIAMGDTLFHSHFATGAGLNRIMNIAVRSIYLLDILV